MRTDGDMPVTDSMKNKVCGQVEETLEILGHLDLLEHLKIGWSSRFTSAMGKARYSLVTKEIRFSIPLWPRATEEQRRETVIHEVCHIVSRKEANDRGINIRAHGPEWRALMRKCGVKPDRTHDVDNRGLSNRRRIALKCRCSEPIKVTPYIAGRMAAGAKYGCRACGSVLTAPEGTEPVKRRNRRRKGY